MITRGTLLICLILSVLLNISATLRAQTFQSYFTGDTSDVNTDVKGGVVLMGGATESDQAMRWFLEQSGGGDILIIRASGSNGYNNYLYSQLGVSVNSVQTIVTTSLAAANEPYVAQQIRNAEALWLAGGDQGNYVKYWKDGPVEEAIRYLIHTKKAPVGGTSAGMAVLGQAYFSALNGTVTSSQALVNPYNSKVALGFADFLDYDDLKNVITDTHYDNPDRRGRHVTFMARLAQDYGIWSKGIASEEYTAVCIDSSGWARVFGAYPQDQDYAYFIQMNCALPDAFPQVCMAATPLEWSQSQAALKVYKAPGDVNGSSRFNIRDWKTTSGTQGVWENWWVENGVLKTAQTTPLLCLTGTDALAADLKIQVSPNPSNEYIQIQAPESSLPLQAEIINLQGVVQERFTIEQPIFTHYFQVKQTGLYLLRTRSQTQTGIYPILLARP